ncbi:hypothetical protein OR1_02867 [Geobacter sp. OR-1]|uniref:lipopolysaccharide biosynthesis protein n=1 Tax=Geobacter sp. OR-1 TaxID=1266765 RepID=UPI000542AF28|nr:oligosaccharide flippase family protein [Geobacter sp. OR-1]GAM10578.1 hypothetical protein OR1_02867 [Geobacter sp. OR-1]
MTESEKNAISTSVIAVSVSGIIASFFCVIFNDEFAKYIFGSIDFIKLVNVGAATLLFDLVYMALSFQFLVAQKSIQFVKLNLVKLAAGIIGNLIFIVWYKMGAIGMLYGNLLSYVPVTAIGLYIFYKNVGFNISLNVMNKMLIYGYPMVPASLLATFLHSGDRFFLRTLGSIEQVGLLTMGLTFPSMLNSALLTSFNSIWGGAAMFRISKQADSDYQTAKIATYFMTVFVVIQATLGIFSTTLMNIFVDDKFFEANKVIAIVCIGYSFHAFYTFLTMGAFTKAKTSRMVIAYAVPVLIKSLISYLVISSFGYIASAYIISIGYLVFSITCYVLYKNITTAKFEFKRLIILFVISISAIIISNSLSTFGVIVNSIIQLSTLLAMLLIMWFSPFMLPDEKNMLKQEINKYIKNYK